MTDEPRSPDEPVRVLFASRARGGHEQRIGAAFEAAGMAVRHVGLASVPAAGRPAVLLDAAAALRPDVVVAGPILDITLAAARAGVHPLIALSFGHDLLLDVREPAGEAAAREALAGCDALLGDADAVLAAAAALGGPRLTDKAAWGVDLERFRPSGAVSRAAVRARVGWPPDAFVLLSARAHEPLYRVDVVLDAFRRAAADRPELRLVVLGDGSQRTSLEQAVADAELADRVHFAGRAMPDELPGWCAASDLYVSASLVDGSSVSLMEAMASGLPAVVTNVGGNPEWIAPGETGWLVPVNDAGAMAAALLTAASQGAADRTAMAQAARHRAEANADWRINGPAMAAFVERVARQPRPG